jgi:hypothetical protein
MKGSWRWIIYRDSPRQDNLARIAIGQSASARSLAVRARLYDFRLGNEVRIRHCLPRFTGFAHGGGKILGIFGVGRVGQAVASASC